MIKIDFNIHWLIFLAPVFLYAEIHYRIWNIFSRYFKREPEIVADIPHRIGPEKTLPVFLCIKDADEFSVKLDNVKIQTIKDSHERILFEMDFDGQEIVEPLWYSVFECDVNGLHGDIQINVIVSYTSRGKKIVCVNDNYKLTSHDPFSVYVDDSPRPKMDGWAFGDMHTHSHLTSDQVEFGAPFEVTAAMARALELDFFASTDHSYDREDNYLVNDPALPKWKKMWELVTTFNKRNQDMVIIPGEELSAGNSKKQNVHQLIFNNKKFWHGQGDSAEQWFRTRPQHDISDVLPHLEDGALSFAAHPLIDPPFVQKLLIRRGMWTDDDLQSEGLHGAQFWNGDKNHFLTIGLKKWVELLLAGHKTILIAGSDAHGNFNRFRQIATPHLTMREEQYEIFATTVTGIEIEGELSLDSILGGLRKGRVIVTDGPVAESGMRSAVSQTRNANGLQRVHIGDMIHFFPRTIDISAMSSPSYGELYRVELVLGSISAKKETRKQIDLPSGYDFCETVRLENGRQPGYIRLEVESRIGDRSFHCFTNPIFFD